jgi:hypothetical protein
MKRVYPEPADTDRPCTECDGEKGFEVPVGMSHGSDGYIRYRWERCERCGGTGVEPE